jgi:RNA polymerase sigma-70 factor, ECF subfamily
MADSPTTLMEQLHEEHAAALWEHCLRLTGHDRARAEDVAQETMLRAWRNLSRLDDSQGSVRAWLFTVARNIVIDEWRSRRTRAELLLADVPDVAEAGDRTEQLVQSWVVADALARLSPDHRAVIGECYYRGASVAEASRRLGVPEGTVKSRAHYALRALRLALQEMGVDT